MNLVDIQPAIPMIAMNPVVTVLRRHTYLATYPGLVAIGTAPGVVNTLRFLQLATMVYGWMPRVVRVDAAHTAGVVAAFCAARAVTSDNFYTIPIQEIADCLHSVVGASKMLHFINPSVFPIWDSKIERFRALPNSKMNSVGQYIDYVHEANSIRVEPGFTEFYNGFCNVYSNRLLASGIDAYAITEVRAIESAAFELSP